MSDVSGLQALGRALDIYLSGEYAPPPGTQTALGFLPGIAVDPASFAPTGVVNPLAVQTFLDAVANVMGPIVDGRFAGFVSASSMYGALVDLATPVDALGTPAADAFLRVAGRARADFGVGPVKPLVSVPLDWFDATRSEAWNSFSTTVTGTSGESTSESSGTTSPPGLEVSDEPVVEPAPRPPQVDPLRFDRLWRWRTLDETTLAEVVIPVDAAPVESPVVEPQVDPTVLVEPQTDSRIVRPRVFDHVGVDLEEVSVRRGSHLSVRSTDLSPAGPSPAVEALAFRAPPAARGLVSLAAPADDARMQVLAVAPRRQLIAALDDRPPMWLADDDLRRRSDGLADLIATAAPQVVATLDGDGETSSTQSVETHELTLSMRYCFVQISRDSWWNDALLRLPRWYAPGQRAGQFSPADADGVPLGVPIAMVLTRDVSISGRWTESDREAASSHTSIGPWSMSDSHVDYDESSRTATLTMPGLQVVAVVCAVLPELPPCDDPGLSAG